MVQEIDETVDGDGWLQSALADDKAKASRQMKRLALKTIKNLEAWILFTTFTPPENC
jgi:hypothetical protein